MPRKKFGLCAQHAQVQFLRPKRQRHYGFAPEPQIAKRHSWAVLPRKYVAAIMLAHILYPKNFPKIVASGLDKKTTFSEAVEIDKASERGIKTVYAGGRIGPSRLPFVAHSYRIGDKANKKAEVISKASGIYPNSMAMNVGVKKNGGLVFFEVSQVNLEALSIRIDLMPKSREKTLALKLLEVLKEEAGGERILSVHPRG